MNIVNRKKIYPNTSFFHPNTSLLDDFLSKNLFDVSDWSSLDENVPNVNISETDDAFLVEMAAPGMKKEDFLIRLDNGILSISSEISEEHEQSENLKHLQREFDFTSFKRSFYLPNSVETNKIEARYENGILSLLIPKKEEAKKKPIKNIPIA